jgi:CRISPR-associated endonuclease Csn1
MGKKSSVSVSCKRTNKNLDLEHLAIVLQEVNNDKKKSSGYLGEISDRSKNCTSDKITVGEYLYRQIEQNPTYFFKKTSILSTGLS